MRMIGSYVVSLAFVAALSAHSSFAQSTQSDEERIKDISRQWVQAVADGDIEAIGDLYAPDGRFMAPNAPAAVGREAAQEAWQEILELPELELTFAPTMVRVAESGDIAYAIGTYEFSFEAEQGRVEDRGKYVDLWEQIDGEWKVKADIFNSDIELPRE